MSVTNSLHPVPGRLNHRFGTPPLPTIWVETGLMPVTGQPGGPAHPMWGLPNTYPMIRIDTRRGIDGSGSVEIFGRSGDITPESLARLIAFNTAAYIDAFQARFEAISKPMRFAWLIVGPDAAPGDTTLFLSQDHWDGARILAEWPRQDLTILGQDPPDDVLLPVAAVFFHPNARRHMRAWSDAVWPIVKDKLDNSGLPYPEAVFTDLESKPTYSTSYRTDGETLWDRAFEGWFEDAIYIAKGSPIANLDAQAYELENGIGFRTWLDTQTTTLNGISVPPFNRQARHEHSDNFEPVQKACGASDLSYLETIRYTIYEPIKQTFGESVQCSNWSFVADSRTSPVEIRPKQYKYWRNGVLSADSQIPVNYGNRSSSFLIEDDVNNSDNVNRETVQNWAKRFGVEWMDSDPRYPDSNIRDYLNYRITIGMAMQARRANLGKRICPSISLWQSTDAGFSEQALPLLLRFMRHSVAFGARQFWLFAKEWNNTVDSTERDNHFQLIKQFNGLLKSSSLPRNRSARFIRALHAR